MDRERVMRWNQACAVYDVAYGYTINDLSARSHRRNSPAPDALTVFAPVATMLLAEIASR